MSSSALIDFDRATIQSCVSCDGDVDSWSKTRAYSSCRSLSTKNSDPLSASTREQAADCVGEWEGSGREVGGEGEGSGRGEEWKEKGMEGRRERRGVEGEGNGREEGGEGSGREEGGEGSGREEGGEGREGKGECNNKLSVCKLLCR